ncbi:MAG: alginate lyase family protein, partial [Novosphingobium sp.]
RCQTIRRRGLAGRKPLRIMGLAVAAGLVFGGVGAQGATVDHAIFSPKAPSRVRSPDAERTALIARADAGLARPPAPLGTIHIEGTLPGKGIHDASRIALQDMPVARDLALAWRLTGKTVYLKAAERYILAWATTYQSAFNPIDETGFDALIMAYDLTERNLAPATRRAMDDLLRRLATGYLDRMESGKVVPPQTLTNNWQSHRVKLATLAAFQLGDPALIARARQAYEKQIAANLRPDGSVMDFAMRDALHYVVFTLEPLSVSAYAAKAHGQDWYGYTAPSGASLARSLDWLAAFARGEKTHIEFANSVVPFDRQRREAGVAGFANTAWQPAESTVLFTIASLLDPRFADLARRLPVFEARDDGDTLSAWRLLMPASAKRR